MNFVVKNFKNSKNNLYGYYYLALRSIITSTKSISLDATLIANEANFVKEQLNRRRADEALLDKIDIVNILRKTRLRHIVAGDEARHTKKTLSKDINIQMKANNTIEVDKLKALVEQCNIHIAETDLALEAAETELNKIVSHFPNLLDDSVPDGDSDEHNQVISVWGEDRRKIGDQYLWHDDIARRLNGLEHDAAVRLSGSRFSVLTGSVARLERALIQYFLDFHINRGYTEVSLPYIVSRSCLEGTGQLPKFEDDLFKINHQVGGEDAFLVPTAEVPLTNLFKDQILKASQLPIRLVAHTPSFRAEAGSGGKDTRGLLRQHQFHKVEIIRICSPETSDAEHEALTADAECLLTELELPHRRLLLCSGDTGFSARKCYDLEVWLPGQQAYREISSCSNCHDFQSRRMGLRYREVSTEKGGSGGSGGKKTVMIHPHTLNGSGLAVGRTLAAILENYQQDDGRVKIPEKLRRYLGDSEYLEVNKRVLF